MTRERQPFSRENVNDISLSQVIATQVAILGDQNHPQPNPRERDSGFQIRPDFDYCYGGNGSLDFGSKWSVHRTNVGTNELIFAAKSHHGDQDPQAEFYIHEFNEAGQIARTWFTQTAAGEIWKQRQTTFGTGVGESFVELTRQLSAEEVSALMATIANPAGHRSDLDGLVALSDQETAAIIQAKEENSRGVRQLKADLGAHDTTRRLGWVAALNDTTLY